MGDRVSPDHYNKHLHAEGRGLFPVPLPDRPTPALTEEQKKERRIQLLEKMEPQLVFPDKWAGPRSWQTCRTAGRSPTTRPPPPSCSSGSYQYGYGDPYHYYTGPRNDHYGPHAAPHVGTHFHWSHGYHNGFHWQGHYDDHSSGGHRGFTPWRPH